MNNDNDSDEKNRPLDRITKAMENCFIATVFGFLLCILALAAYAALGLATPLDITVVAKIIGVAFLGGFAAALVGRFNGGEAIYDPMVIHGTFAITPGILTGLIAFVVCLLLALDIRAIVRVVATAFLGGLLVVLLGCQIAGSLGGFIGGIAAFLRRFANWLFAGHNNDKGESE